VPRDPSAPDANAPGDPSAPRDPDAPRAANAPREPRAPRDDRPREGNRQRRDWAARGGQRGGDGTPSGDAAGTAIPGELSGAITAGAAALDAGEPTKPPSEGGVGRGAQRGDNRGGRGEQRGGDPRGGRGGGGGRGEQRGGGEQRARGGEPRGGRGGGGAGAGRGEQRGGDNRGGGGGEQRARSGGDNRGGDAPRDGTDAPDAGPRADGAELTAGGGDAAGAPDAGFREDGTRDDTQRTDGRGDNRGGRGQPRGGGRGESRGGRGGEPRGGGRGESRGGRGGEPRASGDHRGGGPDHRGPDAQAGAPDALAGVPDVPRAYDAPAAPRLQQRRRQPAHDELESAGEQPTVAWGSDDAGPPPAIVFAADLPVDAPATDLDPLTSPLLDAPSASLGDDIASVVGVRFQVGGRIQWCDAGDADFARGERVLVDSDRGQRIATVATPPTRRATRERNMRRVIRRASDQDLRGEHEVEGDRGKALRLAKDVAAQLRLPLKVFRVEMIGQGRGAKLNVYYTSDERLDLREFIQTVGRETQARLELRQLGVRDEAKAVGGIGSCGLTLCCTTWLPDFVPVSIKMAKDQGLVLSPTKVAGQCGRLKCCLVYEQAAYAELRKGLPKLGKRVISPRGEGRVVEVDVLRQRIRVSYGMGDTEVLPATEVKPLFPAGNQPRAPRAEGGSPGPEREAEPETEADEAPEEFPIEQLPPTDDSSEGDHGPTDDPSSDDFQA